MRKDPEGSCFSCFHGDFLSAEEARKPKMEKNAVGFWILI